MLESCAAPVCCRASLTGWDSFRYTSSTGSRLRETTRFATPRQTLPPSMGGGEVIEQSKWTPFRIRAPEPNQRELWLAEMDAAKPQDTAELLTDFLPSVLGVADASSHAIVRSYLYHPDGLVRRYTLRGLLTFWPEATVSELTAVLLRGGGPKDLMNEFSIARWDLTTERADELIEQALPYLLPEPTIVGEGAVVILRRALPSVMTRWRVRR